jgi:hypothetical protein
LWLARWLAELDETEELRRLAASGSYPALVELAEWLARLRERAEAGDENARQVLAGWPD